MGRPWVWVLPAWVTRRQFVLCKLGPGALSMLGGGGRWQPETRPCMPAARPAPGLRRNTHLEHDFVDSSSVRFKVEVFIVMIA